MSQSLNSLTAEGCQRAFPEAGATSPFLKGGWVAHLCVHTESDSLSSNCVYADYFLVILDKLHNLCEFWFPHL